MRVLGCCNAALVLAIASVAGAGAACGSREPRTDAERLARGREIVERMSEKLGSAKSFSVTVTESREEAKRDGTPQHATLTRETIVRRPDRFYTTVTGDRHNEVWYDGIGITVVLHNEKIFGQARAPETLDKTLDALYERFGVSVPLADYVYSSPAKALLTDTITGGWARARRSTARQGSSGFQGQRRQLGSMDSGQRRSAALAGDRGLRRQPPSPKD